MARPKKKRVVRFDPQVTYFKPRGIPLSELDEVVLTVEEVEATRLADLKEMSQTKAAKEMKISQSTFNRILTSVHKKIGDALTSGKAIKVEGGDYKMAPIGLGRGGGYGGRGRAPAGGGRGRMGGPFAAGPGGTCVCTSCGHEAPHQAGVPCYQQKCPKCGAAMVRKR